MKKIAFSLILAILFLGFSGCQRQGEQKARPEAEKAGVEEPKAGETEILGVEEIARQVQAKYSEAMEKKLPKEEALNEAVKFLKQQKNIKEVKILGSDSVMVYFTDGNELMIMLGKDRI
ncbi:MAG: hypothetical protein PHU81_04490 [Acidobacteriota bacterium]|nr:hypothetical protein [Acidobacteriota bacterium]